MSAETRRPAGREAHVRVSSIRIVALLLLVALLATPAVGAPLDCRVTTKVACGPDGCVAAPPAGAYNRIDLARGVVERCDAKGCDAHQVSAARSGIYINLSFGRGAAFIRLEEPTMAYMEVITLGLSTIVSHGACR